MMQTGSSLYQQLKEQREREKTEEEPREAKRRRVRANKLKFEQPWSGEYKRSTEATSNDRGDRGATRDAGATDPTGSVDSGGKANATRGVPLPPRE